MFKERSKQSIEYCMSINRKDGYLIAQNFLKAAISSVSAHTDFDLNIYMLKRMIVGYTMCVIFFSTNEFLILYFYFSTS